MAASSSTAAQSNNHPWFDVFINHRGPDVKETFTRPLYLRLLSNGLRTFLDKEEMQPGYNFPRQIEHAIRTASVHVAIFSPKYAESHWCLNELLLMSESKAPIIPVFYRVTPAEVRWTQGKDGNYAQALQQLAEKKSEDPRTHKMKRRYNSKTIKNWRNALSRVADNSGFELEVRNGEELELELLDKLVECLLKMVKRAGLHVAKYPTGLDETLKDFEDTVLLQQQQKDFKDIVLLQQQQRILGIVGLGGVGKTTFAKEFFNRRISDYQKTCFLSDIRDRSSLPRRRNCRVFVARKNLRLRPPVIPRSSGRVAECGEIACPGSRRSRRRNCPICSLLRGRNCPVSVAARKNLWLWPPTIPLASATLGQISPSAWKEEIDTDNHSNRIVELDFKRERQEWKIFGEETEEVGVNIELAIFRVLVEEVLLDLVQL